MTDHDKTPVTSSSEDPAVNLTSSEREGSDPVESDAEMARRDRLVKRQMMRQTATYGSIGIEFGVGLVMGYFSGQWLDEYFGTAPTLMYVMMFAGISVGFLDLFKLVLKTDLSSMDDE